MTEPAKIRLSTRARALPALACPHCEACGAPTRFVGLESIPGDESADLCTYQCGVCEHVQAGRVRRANGYAS
jgi:hypothetical protein